MRNIKVTACALILLLLIVVKVIAEEPGPNLEDKAVKKVSPLYPPLAKYKRVQGKVVVKVQVRNDGTVSSAEFWEGNPVFKAASLDAIEKWSFQKTADGMNGHIIFRFQLDK